LSTVALSPVRQSGFWRVKIAWPTARPRYFGHFVSQTEAEKWIEEHRWLAKQKARRPEEGAAQEVQVNNIRFAK
jgi:hypothetical protein